MATPYAKRPYDDRAYSARMSDLIRGQGQSQADFARREGENSARLASSIGQIAGSTMADLVRLKRDAPLERVRTLQADRMMRDEELSKKVDEVKLKTRGMSPNDAAYAFEEAGLLDEAAAIRKSMQNEVDSANAQNLDQQKRDADAADKAERLKLDRLTKLPFVLETGSRLLSSPITNQADLDARREQLASVAGMVGMDGLVDKSLSPTFGEHTEQERTKALGWMDEQKAPTTEFQMFYHSFKSQKGDPLATPKDFLAQWKEYSSKSDTKGGTIADHLATIEKERGKPLTSAEKMDETVRWEARMAGARREPDKPTTAKDSPAFPAGVDQYLGNMKASGYSRQQAEAELARALPSLLKDHPNLRPLEIQKAVDTYWPGTLATYDKAGLELTPAKSTPPVDPTLSTPGIRRGSMADLAAPAGSPSPSAAPQAPRQAPTAPSAPSLGSGIVFLRLPDTVDKKTGKTIPGKTKTFPSQQAADAFMAEAGLRAR